ncbi:cytochrome c-type biogenesis protein CcmH [Candidatus Poribacteria bacterium]|nr:cytochrome c-type biogenesis protein CcmH [Candidatus Poribacteria bacterium]MYH84134.1 cytochrome c-type biogenesis protein CcmH [Candidatus Poribacteria bacterium]MYK94981.1 cytochrome c-type biogenesis protein CcmH [Candidatus Poribacteria bacterium]
MKTGRFECITTSNEFLILNFVLIVLLLIVCSFIVTGYAQTGESQVAAPKGVEDATVASDLEELLTTVYCHCGCTRETIEVCTCGTAMDIENDFRDRLRAGETVEQIRTDYLDTYGPQYYAVMPVEGINLLAYAMPVIILALIGGIVFVVLRRSTGSMQKTAAGAREASASQVSDETVQQVEAELERYRRES